MKRPFTLLMLSLLWGLHSHAQILVYTGTFDPPHDGHKEILLQAMEQIQARMTFVNPGPTDHKPTARPLELRIEMAAEFFLGMPGVEFPPLEVSELFWARMDEKAMEWVKEHYPQEPLYRVVGTDRMAWETSETVKSSPYTFLVSKRPEDPPLKKELEPWVGRKIFYLPEPELALSSTLMRAEILEGQKPEHMTQGVLDLYTGHPDGFGIRCQVMFQ